MNFAEKMIELRKQQNLSQQDLADRLGVSRQAISRWETGAVQPLADSVKSLAQVFQVSTDYLLNDDLDTPTPPPTAQPAPPQEKPKSARKHRKWLLHWLLWLLPLFWSWSRRWARWPISVGKKTIRYPCMTYYLRRTMVNQTERSQSHGDSRKEVQRFVLLYKTQIP